jgi:hypothetical protein
LLAQDPGQLPGVIQWDERFNLEYRCGASALQIGPEYARLSREMRIARFWVECYGFFHLDNCRLLIAS